LVDFSLNSQNKQLNCKNRCGD